LGTRPGIDLSSPHLTGNLLMQAMIAARKIESKYESMRALIAFIPTGRWQQRSALDEDLNAILELIDVEDRAPFLIELIPHLKGKQQKSTLIEVLDIVRRMSLETSAPSSDALVHTWKMMYKVLLYPRLWIP